MIDFNLTQLETSGPTAATGPVGGFHLQLEGDIPVGATESQSFKPFASLNDEVGNRGLYLQEVTGFDDINGIFRPSNGLYLLSALVHVAVKPSTEEDNQIATTATAPSNEQPRVTVTFCVDNDCGSSA